MNSDRCSSVNFPQASMASTPPAPVVLEWSQCWWLELTWIGGCFPGGLVGVNVEDRLQTAFCWIQRRSLVFSGLGHSSVAPGITTEPSIEDEECDGFSVFQSLSHNRWYAWISHPVFVKFDMLLHSEVNKASSIGVPTFPCYLQTEPCWGITFPCYWNSIKTPKHFQHLQSRQRPGWVESPWSVSFWSWVS